MPKKKVDNYSTSPFYDVGFARQHVRKGRLVSDRNDLCTACHMPPPAEWCWAHHPACPLHMPLRGAATLTVRCEFAILGVPPQPGTMTFHHGSNFAQFVSDDGRHRSHVRLDLLRGVFREEGT